MIDYKFYDTSSLLIAQGQPDFINSSSDQIYLSSISLKEIEKIKNSDDKSPDVKFAARHLSHLIDTYPNKFEIVFFKNYMLEPIIKTDLLINDDMRILATAIWVDKNLHPDELIFISNDLSLKNHANLFFGNECIKSYKESYENYKGFQSIQMTEQEMSNFYMNISDNQYNTLINQYLIIHNENGDWVDIRRWDGKEYQPLKYGNCHSKWFGSIKPVKGDIYQSMALDSFYNNDITMICGKPGSGKTMLAFAYLFSELEKGEIDRIVIFCNPVVAKNAAKLGFYPGSVHEKLLSSQVGGILSSKLGSQIEVERLLNEEKLVLVPAGDVRGYETPENSGVYIMESQNLTKDLMRLFLQRIGKNNKVIIDGDYKEQVDMDAYAGYNNGMIALSKVFRGESLYGQVELQYIHRNKIGQIADKIR